MEPEETGLTVAEKFMFLILGLALLLVGGLLIFGNLKSKTKNLQQETKVTEKANNDEVKNETVSDDSEKKEEETTEEDIKNGEKSESETVTEDSKESSSNEKSDEESDTTKSKEEIKDSATDDKENSTTKEEKGNTPKTRVDDESRVLATSKLKQELTQMPPHTAVDEESWSLPTNIILEAYAGDTIEINKTVVNQNGQPEVAQVTVRRLEGNSYNIIETPNNRFVASQGTYKYYYTHNSITKVATLHVDEKATNVSFSPLASFDYVENDEFTKYELTNMIDNSKGTTITKENDIYVINIQKANSTNYSALLINTGEEIQNIKSNTKGIYIGSEYSTLWNENYKTGTARVIINLNYINSGEVIRLRVNVNGKEKIVEIRILITEKKEEKEELESDQGIIDNKLEIEEKETKEEQTENVSKSSNKEELEIVPEQNQIINVEEGNDLNQSLDRT